MRQEKGLRDTLRQDYSQYHMTKKDITEGIVLYALLDLVISYLFFESWIAFLILAPGVVLMLRELRIRKKEARRKRMNREFLDAIQMLSASLQAGYSIENALKEAVRELRKIVDEKSEVLQEFRLMDAQVAMSKNLEELFLDFGMRSGIDDIKSFGEVFSTARRTGGDLLSIIRNTSACIRQKQATMQEIETCISGKVMEQNVMSCIPVFIVGYVKFSSPEFITPVYGNVRGVLIMTGCLIVYIAAYFWGQSIVRIEV